MTQNHKPMLERRSKLLHQLNLKGRGLEIGPSFNPTVCKREGYNVEILDHLSTEDLKEKYAARSVERIEEVDYVSDGRPLHETVNKTNHYDYIIASHVIEHMPDLVRFLHSCDLLLKDGGILSLAIPDHRYCFDHFRPVSTVGECLQAYMEERRIHTFATLYDDSAYFAMRDDQIWWRAGDYRPLRLKNSVSAAYKRAQDAVASGEYHDAHAWRFTLPSFRVILNDLAALKLISLRELHSFDTFNSEFYIALTKSPDTPSGQDRLALCLAVGNS